MLHSLCVAYQRSHKKSIEDYYHMHDISYCMANRRGKTFTIIGKPGVWELMREEGDCRSKSYIFRRESLKSPGAWTETRVSTTKMYSSVFEVTD
jgi:hypothetical protein